ncbi:DUF6468 domain-containing protein [Minwuia thermotolerans]|uniref:DUF6468 domain-containing protein n=1 Tax=Minwuia thermotolerans TaxID=2056226 RepID=A0A2M9FXQ9_9PROT|nr:DUF6468 domain-containing protein [Minwuia thermotolerans]PJK28248.1 hypothetical protein CVT23_17910 [Minwuia thermotolerans]
MDLGVDVILDGLLAVLLAATVIYCFVLNRRLSRLRNAQGEMAELVRSFHQATENARASVGELKVAANAVGADLQKRIDAGRSMLDELEVVVHSGGKVAERIEQGVDRSKAAAPAETQRQERSPAEHDLLQALRKVR